MAPVSKQSCLQDWMETKLNRRDYPGLTWLNEKRKIFKLQWYHTKDVPQERKQIVFKPFVDWGYFSNRGKFKKEDYSHFKRNMRCALNKPESSFKKLKDNSKCADDPHLVYEFTNYTVPTKPLPLSQWNNDDCVQNENIPQHVNDFCSPFYNNLHETASMGILNGSDPIQQPSSMSLCDDTQCQQFPNTPPETAQVTSTTYHQEISPEAHFVPQLSNDLMLLSFDDLIEPHDLAALPMSSASTLSTSEWSTYFCAQPQPSLSTVSRNATSADTRKHRMKIEISYGQPRVAIINSTVGENGCRLHFNTRSLKNTPFEDEMYGAEQVKDIMLPDVDQCGAEHINTEQKLFINNILKKMERGFILTFKDGDIFAQRFSATRIYFCDEHFQCKCLDRKSKIPVKVFDFKNFMSKLDKCCNSSDTPAKLPPAHFYLSIGIEVDTAHKNGPLSEVLITVCVTHKVAEEKANFLKSQRGHFSQPFYSDFDSMDKLLEHTKDQSMVP